MVGRGRAMAAMAVFKRLLSPFSLSLTLGEGGEEPTVEAIIKAVLRSVALLLPLFNSSMSLSTDFESISSSWREIELSSSLKMFNGSTDAASSARCREAVASSTHFSNPSIRSPYSFSVFSVFELIVLKRRPTAVLRFAPAVLRLLLLAPGNRPSGLHSIWREGFFSNFL